MQFKALSMGTIATWTQQAGSGPAVVNTLSYDPADQLTNAVQSGGGTAHNAYQYDPAGNRLAEVTGSGTTAGQFNNLNQLTGYSGGAGSQTVAGHTSAPVSSVTVNAVPATVSSSTNFSATVPLPAGTNTLSVVAQPGTGPVTTRRYQVVTPGTAPTALTYDANGNTLTDENGNSYSWDALNRLTQITYPSGASSSFAYDGLSRRIAIIEKNAAGTTTSTKNYLWIGQEIAEERDSSNAVTKRFFRQGEQQAGTAYYYTRDHLRSVREVCNSSGTILTRYTYDPYGRATTNHLSGSVDATFQYGGYYAHQPSGLSLTNAGDGHSTGRPYNPDVGWINRDPIGEAGGINLYGYVRDNPVNIVDPSGEECLEWVELSRSGPLSSQEDGRTRIAETPWEFAGYVVVGVPEFFVILKVEHRLVRYQVEGHTMYSVDYARLCRCDASSPWMWQYDRRTISVPYKYTTDVKENRFENVEKPDEDVRYPKPPIEPVEPLPPVEW
jgi:RHS repeat-associated protein